MKVFVTGARGYIGQVLCKMLKEEGHFVYGCDIKIDYKNSCYCDDYHNISYANYFAGDCDAVIHLGAHSLLGPSATDPMKYYWNNVGGTAALLSRLDQRPMIFASSAAVYANKYSIPVNEDRMELKPPNNYGMSKLMGEQLMDSYVEAFPNTTITSFRFFNVVGSYNGQGIQNDTPHIMSQLVKAHKNKSTFTINGSEYLTQDGTCVRDYVHVVDICRAMLYALRNITEPGHRKYNLGTSKGYSNLEVTMRFQAMVGDQFTYQFGPNRKGDPAYLVADGNKFVKETGFKYTHSNSLTMMINDTLQAHGVHVDAF